ncbi:MAG: NAD(P)-dependent oxidoreductase [Candidatus Solibacter usitatus]|nr:NAD(P)-dependent oxidoreductase [Candidatus Solibacter usitatus]
MISSEPQLEEFLSAPSETDVQALARLEGDLLILGVAGKMGPSLARRAKRACPRKRVIGVARFSDPAARRKLEEAGVETVQADLLDPGALAQLPSAANVIHMAARKFGSTGNEHLTWAMNTLLPGLVCERFRDSRIVVFSTGNVYPLTPVALGGPVETSPVGPVGEYAQSALGRERICQYYSDRYKTPVTLLRLNYAVELRYGVLLDIGRKVFGRQPVDVTMGYVNVIWQGDANSVALRAFTLAQSPPAVLNVTGPEALSVRSAARRFADRFGMEPVYQGMESDSALLSNAARCHSLLGVPSVTVEQMIEWTADWIASGGATLDKPTHFEVRDGRF